MTTWQSALRSAGILASQLHGDLNIDLRSPVDVFGAIERLGIVLAFGNLQNTSGVYLPSQARGTPPGILIHQGHPLSRQRFTAAHELGHHVFEHGLEVDGDIDALMRQGVGQMPGREMEAEAFAAWFLMPRRLLNAGIRQLGLPMESALDAYALSLWLGTSYAATVRQLQTMRIITPPVASEWVSVAPKRIKLALTGGRDIDDFRNDVWRLGASSSQHPLTVRPGDRLLVQLEENSSTGYTWVTSELPMGVEIVADSFADQWDADEPPGANRLTEQPGHPRQRSLLLSVSADLPETILRLALELVRPWQPQRVQADYELLIGVTERKYGLQEPEERLRMPA